MCVWCRNAMSVCALSFFLSMLHSVRGSMWLNGWTLCQMTELSLCSLISKQPLLPSCKFVTIVCYLFFSAQLCINILAFCFKPLILCCCSYYPVMISPGWGKPFGQNIHLKGLKTFMKNRVADRGWGGGERERSFPVIFLVGKHTCTDSNWSCRLESILI